MLAADSPSLWVARVAPLARGSSRTGTRTHTGAELTAVTSDPTRGTDSVAALRQVASVKHQQPVTLSYVVAEFNSRQGLLEQAICEGSDYKSRAKSICSVSHHPPFKRPFGDPNELRERHTRRQTERERGVIAC